jgi:hypothetical protein
MIEKKTSCSVYKTQNLELIQDDRTGKIWIDFYGDLISFRVCEFFSFKRKIHQIDLLKMLDEASSENEIIFLANCDRFLLLSFRQVLELKDLLSGGHVMLELNRMIHQQLVRPLG